MRLSITIKDQWSDRTEVHYHFNYYPTRDVVVLSSVYMFSVRGRAALVGREVHPDLCPADDAIWAAALDYGRKGEIWW